MRSDNTITVQLYHSPIGKILLGSIGNALCLCDWRTESHSQRIDTRLQRMLSATYKEGTSEVIESAKFQLDEYFLCKRTHFDLPILLKGSAFQIQVWNELLRIPYAETITYAELAKRIGKATAYRAVANANNANHLSVIIPCHRVIASDQTIAGYGGGIEIKQKLLEMERDGSK